MKRVIVPLTPKQSLAYQALNEPLVEDVLFGGGAGGGKSYLACVWLVDNILQYPDTRWFLARTELKALKETTLLTLFQVMKAYEFVVDKDYKYHSQDGQIEFMNGATVFLKDVMLKPADPEFDSLGSTEYTGGIIEEAQQTTHKAYETLKTRCRYNLDKYNLRGQVLLTCNPHKGYLYSTFYQPFVQGRLDPNKRFIQSLATDNPKLPKAYIEKLRGVKDEATKQRLLLGNWDYENTSNQVIAQQWINNSLVDNYEDGKKVMGVDIAREGGDKTVIALWVGNVLVDIKHITVDITGQSDISGKIADEIIAYATNHGVGYEDINIDAVGVGGGVIDACRARGYFVSSYKGGESVDVKEQFTEYRNLRTYSYWKLREGFQSMAVKILRTIPYFDDLCRELTTHEYDTNDKLIILEEKDKIKAKIGRSPDYSDAVVMGYAPQPKNNFGFVF
jgi:hypothetical protein